MILLLIFVYGSGLFLLEQELAGKFKVITLMALQVAGCQLNKTLSRTLCCMV